MGLGTDFLGGQGGPGQCPRFAGLRDSIISVLLPPFPGSKTEKGTQLTENSDSSQSPLSAQLSKAPASPPWPTPPPPNAGSSACTVPVSLLSLCLCPLFSNHPPLHQILSSCIRGPLHSLSWNCQTKRRAWSTVSRPPGLSLLGPCSWSDG